MDSVAGATVVPSVCFAASGSLSAICLLGPSAVPHAASVKVNAPTSPTAHAIARIRLISGLLFLPLPSHGQFLTWPQQARHPTVTERNKLGRLGLRSRLIGKAHGRAVAGLDRAAPVLDVPSGLDATTG